MDIVARLQDLEPDLRNDGYRDSAKAMLDAAREIEAVRSLARDAYDAWDHDRDAKVGKLLRAIVDDDFRAMYRPDLAAPNASNEPTPLRGGPG
jgi:hypothetical protein